MRNRRGDRDCKRAEAKKKEEEVEGEKARQYVEVQYSSNMTLVNLKN